MTDDKPTKDEICSYIEEHGALEIDYGKWLIECPESEKLAVCCINFVLHPDQNKQLSACSGELFACGDQEIEEVVKDNCPYNPKRLSETLEQK